MRKKLAILIIGLMLINILSFIKPVQANPAAALMGPGVYYAIAGGLTGIGLYAKDNEALQYAVQDYWNKQNEYTKSQWRNAVKYGVIAGKIISNASTTRSLLNYANTYFKSGNNVITTQPFSYQHTTGEIVAEQGIKTIGALTVKMYIQNDLKKFGLYNENGNRVGTCDWNAPLNYDISDFGLYTWYIDGIEWKICLYIVRNGEIYKTGYGFNIPPIKIRLPIIVGGNEPALQATGDVAGFGTALAPDQEVKVPCPPVPEIDWPDSWVDDLERSMNETGNPSIDDETSIQEGEDDWDWYVDKDTGEIYKRRKGEGPRTDDDRKIGFPVPVPEPNVPDDFPDINNPDETTTEYPPETEIINNPDGTTTEKTIQHSDTTRKFYDPLTNKWTETTTRTTTTTETTLGPDGLPLGPPLVTVTTGPPTTVTTNPPTDDSIINFEPFKKLAHIFTTKFPFSLPWDFKRGIESLEGGEWDRKIVIPAIGDYWPEMTIDLTMFDNIAAITRIIMLIVFDFGLIFATRKLMGGDV